MMRNMRDDIHDMKDDNLSHISEFSKLLYYGNIISFCNANKHQEEQPPLSRIIEFLNALTNLCDEQLDHSLSLQFPEYAHLTDTQCREIIEKNDME